MNDPQTVHLLAEIRSYADGRKSDVARGAETPALAALMFEKYGYGLVKAAGILGVPAPDQLMQEVDRLVVEINPECRRHRQYRWESRPAGLALTDTDGRNHRVV